MRGQLTRNLSILFLSQLCISYASPSYSESSWHLTIPPARLDLVVIDVVPSFPPYARFCERHPGDCDMAGVDAVELNAARKLEIIRINAQINHAVKFVPDMDQYGKEEYWEYPTSGFGDCEDKALEKRRRLVQRGFPRSVLRLAIGFHKRLLHSHCLLTVETTEGTYVLDSMGDAVRIWYQTPYDLETRERIDGQWDRFDQGIWSFPHR